MALNSKILKTALSESLLIAVWCGGIFWAKDNIDLPKFMFWVLYASAPMFAIKNLQSYWKAMRDGDEDEEEDVSRKAKPAQPKSPLQKKPVPHAAPSQPKAPQPKAPSKHPKRQPVTKQGFKKRTPKKK